MQLETTRKIELGNKNMGIRGIFRMTMKKAILQLMELLQTQSTFVGATTTTTHMLLSTLHLGVWHFNGCPQKSIFISISSFLLFLTMAKMTTIKLDKCFNIETRMHICR
jgi:hypothetical protein